MTVYNVEQTYPSRDGIPEPDSHIFQELNYTYQAPIVKQMLPDPLPAQVRFSRRLVAVLIHRARTRPLCKAPA